MPADPLLASYLRSHWLALHGEVRLAARAASRTREPTTREALTALSEQAGQDRDVLLSVLRMVGVHRPRSGERLVSVAERLGRLKTNGTVVRRSPVSDLVELEGWIDAVHLRRLGWVSLSEAAATAGVDLGLDAEDLHRLIIRAEDHIAALEHLHRIAARRALGDPSRTEQR